MTYSLLQAYLQSKIEDEKNPPDPEEQISLLERQRTKRISYIIEAEVKDKVKTKKYRKPSEHDIKFYKLRNKLRMQWERERENGKNRLSNKPRAN